MSVCAEAHKKYIKVLHCPNGCDHMVPWWKRKVDLLCAILQSRISCFIMSPGLSGMSSIGTERRKLLVMPEEALSISVWALFSLCLGTENIKKKKEKKSETEGTGFTVQWWCWHRSLWQSSLSTLEEWIFVCVTRGSGSRLYQKRQSSFSWNCGENIFGSFGESWPLHDKPVDHFLARRALLGSRKKDFN